MNKVERAVAYQQTYGSRAISKPHNTDSKATDPRKDEPGSNSTRDLLSLPAITRPIHRGHFSSRSPDLSDRQPHAAARHTPEPSMKIGSTVVTRYRIVPT